MSDESSEIFFHSFLMKAVVCWSGTGRDVRSLKFRPVFPLPTAASPILRGTLKDGFGEAVVTP